MRELKFRIWIKDEERYYDEADEESYEIIPNGQVTYTSEAYEEDGVFYTDTTNATDNVIVEQYTGLKDKDGKEIYEGDLLMLTDYQIEIDGVMGCMKGEVKWDENYFAYSLGNIENGIMLLPKRNDYIVMGNTHENPDLLEEEK